MLLIYMVMQNKFLIFQPLRTLRVFLCALCVKILTAKNAEGRRAIQITIKFCSHFYKISF